ncbi:MAG TPA: YigZ family protein [Longimicrobiales bacterium]|nr:YigZ family protein [Longimicrobiales bacterium]
MATHPEPYPIPAARHRVEQSVRRSRFITTMAHAATADDARAVIDEVRAEFPDATHNCWAFAAGPPGATTAIGMSDDGEPHGTAGRPLLEALLHSGVGEVVAVVTRYFGGVKLGKGGLARAYAGGVTQALDTLPRTRRVVRARVRVAVDYAILEPLRRLAQQRDARIEAEDFAATVSVRLAVPVSELQHFRSALADLTAGQAIMEEEDEEHEHEDEHPPHDRRH